MRTGVSAVLAAAFVAIAGGLVTAAPARAEVRDIVCQSHGEARTSCRVPAGARVRLIAQLSAAPCIEGRSWGVGERAIWVARRCAARFRYATQDDRSSEAAALIGGLIVGGIIGAIIADELTDAQRPPGPRPPVGGWREAALQLCTREAHRLARERGALDSRFSHLIAVDRGAGGNPVVQAVMSIRLRTQGSVRVVDRRFRCATDAGVARVTNFDWL